MHYRHELVIATVAAVLVAVAPALAQAPAANPAPSAANAVAKKTLTETAAVLGMVRGANHALNIVNMFEYTASGTVADPNGGQDKVTRITVGYDYVIPAVRSDVEAMTPDGKVKRVIEVAAGPYSWDEFTPGIFLRVAKTPAAERLRQIWIFRTHWCSPARRHRTRSKSRSGTERRNWLFLVRAAPKSGAFSI